MNGVNRGALWQQLTGAALAVGPVPEVDGSRSPWYVRLMLGVAGWIGALFGLAFLGFSLRFLFQREAGAIVTGLVLCACAWALYRALRGNDFAAQSAFAVSLAGQCLVFYGLFDLLHEDLGRATLLLMLSVFEFALALAIADSLHRTWCALAGTLCAYFALTIFGLEALALAAIAAAFASVCLEDERWAAGCGVLHPLGDALGIALAVLYAIWALWPEVLHEVMSRSNGPWLTIPAWTEAALLGVVLAAVAWRIAARLQARLAAQLVAVAGALAVTASAHEAPGIPAALLIVVVGFAVSRRFLVGLGILALLGYLSHFYYSLHQTLLHKSITLIISGATLLLLSWVMQRAYGRLGTPGARTAGGANA